MNDMKILIGCITVLGLLWFGRKNRGKTKNGKSAVDLAAICDVHSHILPGVDDGAKNMDMTMRMLGMAYQQGVRQMIATPHYHIGHNSTRPEQLQEVFQKVKREAAEQYPELQLKLGAEIFYSEGVIDRLKEKEALTMAESPYVLVEFRLDDTFSRLKEAVINLQRMGYRPIIAHAERYQCLNGKTAHVMELRNLGAKIQVNFNSISRNKKLFRQGLVDFLGTDCHDDERRIPRITENLQELASLCTREQMQTILEENPRMLWNYKSEK